MINDGPWLSSPAFPLLRKLKAFANENENTFPLEEYGGCEESECCCKRTERERAIIHFLSG